MVESGNVLRDKSYSIAIKAVKLCGEIQKNRKEFNLTNQLIRSGTSIGANTREAIHSQSKRDFIAKLYIVLKETEESKYWLELLVDTGYTTKEEVKCMYKELIEIAKIITSSIVTTKSNIAKNV
ncbi:MAG TPA: four helix bundle protein [Clostridiales bacterium]|nr:MAG: hypothetical protein A2Y22_07695 [Clostridiales bacterium GWD2_32_59]HAN09184.1 four helix bundle protein [Clostridiales bacterium]